MSAVWDTDYLWRDFQGAKLASLFGLDQTASQGNESFQFTAPKQPKKTSSVLGPPTPKPDPPPGPPAVLLATAVQAYRFVNGQYVKQGKVGAAVLGSHSTREFNILIYGTQQKQITTAKIQQGFVFTVQPGNYGTFYDDQRQIWSLMFDSERAGIDFCKEVCVARRNSEPALDSLVTQDLALGEGHALDRGDTVEVTFTGWLLQNQHIGQMFDSNTGRDKLLRVKLGAGKAIKGLEEGMLGMQKGGRRLLIVPPSLAYGSKGTGHVPPASTLIYDVEIRRVKLAKQGGWECQSEGSASDSPSPCMEQQGSEQPCQPPSSIPAQPGRSFHGKSNSINEQLMNPDAAKAKLISRMAKMGQPMLPFPSGAVPAQTDSSSELEDHSECLGRGPASPSAPSHLFPQPIQTSASPSHVFPQPIQTSASPCSLSCSATSLQPVSMETAAPQAVDYGNSSHGFQFQCPSHLQPIGPFLRPHVLPYQVPSDVTSFMMTEARQHNTEIRLAIGKVGDKIDLLASKVDQLVKHGGSSSLGLSSMSMETGMIVHNIQRIFQENVCLKKEVLEKSLRVEEQSLKIGELIEQNQRCMEQSSLLLEQRTDVLKTSSQQNQAGLLQAEQDKVRLTEELAASSSLVSQLQQESSSFQQSVSDVQARLSAALLAREDDCSQIISLERRVDELKALERHARTQWRQEKHTRTETELRVTSLEEQLEDLTTHKHSLDQMLCERRSRWQQERQRLAEELEEVRRSSQQETHQLWLQLRQTRSTAEHGVREQMQAEMEREWQARCSRAVSLAKEQLSSQLTEVTEQRDGLASALTQLQDKYTSGVTSKEKRQAYHNDMEDQVKRVMNRVFHSLRGQFDVHESYQGDFILDVILRTIRNVTLELLMAEEEEDMEEEKQVLQQNGTRADEERKETFEICPTISERESSGGAQTIAGSAEDRVGQLEGHQTLSNTSEYQEAADLTLTYHTEDVSGQSQLKATSQDVEFES